MTELSTSRRLRTGEFESSRSARSEGAEFPFLFTVQVWGEPYTSIFIDIMMPCAAAPGNIGCFDRNSEFRIYTKAADAERITSSAAYKRICSFVSTRVELIDDWAQNSAHEIMSECQRRAANDATHQNKTVVFLAPDTAISENMFSKILVLRSAGYRAVMLPSVRVSLESVYPALLGELAGDGVLALSSRQLVRVMIANLHPISKCIFWDSPNFTVHPSHIYWRVDNAGILAMCAHIHPIMVAPMVADPTFMSTIDGDYVPSAVPDPDKIYNVTDSDEMMIVEISSDSQLLHPIAPAKADVADVARWAEWCTNATHRRNMDLDFYLHSDEIDGRWSSAVAESAQVRRAVLDLLSRPKISIVFKDRKSFLGRLRRNSQDIEKERLKLRRALAVGHGIKESVAYTKLMALSARNWVLGQAINVAMALTFAPKRLFSFLYRIAVYGTNGPTILHYDWLDHRAATRIVKRLLDRPQAKVLMASFDLHSLDASKIVRENGHTLTHLDAVEHSSTLLAQSEGKWSLPDKSFDVVVCYNCLERCRRPQFCAKEMIRALRPKGELLIFGPSVRIRDQADKIAAIEQLHELVKAETEVNEAGFIGGIGSAIADVFLAWPVAMVRRFRYMKPLWIILLLGYIPYALFINTIGLLLNFVDSSRLCYARCFIRCARPENKSKSAES